MGKYLSDVCKNGSVVIRRGDVAVALYRMTSNRSMHTAKNPKLLWKYSAISNPYISRNHTTSVLEESNPIVDVPDVRWLTPEYNNEIYLSNRILAFERDGWKCTRCGGREELQAHHIEPVPKGVFDSTIVHRIENLQTLCATCHARLPKTAQSSMNPQNECTKP